MLEDVPSLSPLSFFSVACDCYYVTPKKKKGVEEKKWLLPQFSSYLAEEAFSDVYLGWNEDGIFVTFDVHCPFQKVEYPDFRKGDSMEIFIDTRDVKTKSFFTRFCHHFLFFSENKEEIKSQEITRFRGEERHLLCDPKLLEVHTTFSPSSYKMDCFIPSRCLHGYDPLNVSCMGFTYLIHRHQNTLQHFVVSSQEYFIERNPSYWCSMRFRR